MIIYRKCGICGRKVPENLMCKCEIQNERNRYKDYNKRVRYSDENKKYSGFYNSPSWHRMSDYTRIKYNGLCLMCLLRHNKITPCDVVHHLEEIRTTIGWEHRLNEDGLIPLCHSCHNWLHKNYTKEKEIIAQCLISEYESLYK